jgi:hypothetical protein
MQSVFGGRDSNHTKDRILKESNLIEAYRHSRTNFEKMFWLFGSSSEHAPANMGKTLNQLLNHMIKHKTHEFIIGRKATSLPDVMEIGLSKCKPNIDINVDLQLSNQQTSTNVQEANEDDEDTITEQLETEDDGEEGWPVEDLEEETVNEDDIDIE